MKKTVQLLLAIFLLLTAQSVIKAQCGSATNSFPVVSKQTHDKVLDILFPREFPSANKADFFFVLRFQPSFADESQIVISKSKNIVEITEYKSLSGNIYDKLNEILAKTCVENAAEMAKQIKAEKKTIQVLPVKVKQWHNNLLFSLSNSFDVFRQRSQQLDKDGTREIVLDGTTYQLWYMQGGDKISLEFYDAEINDSRNPQNLKIAQWMNSLRREIQK